MKKVLVFFIVMGFLPIGLKADPPKKVTLSYANGKLKIEAEHPTKNVEAHFIDKIIVYVDGKEVKVIDITKQSDAKMQVEELEIPEIKSGCEVEVKAQCNKMGSKKAKLKIE